MGRYATFLRGINVGGHRVKNDELRSFFAAMGFRDVHAFRASGNVIFAADTEPPAQLTLRIEEGLAGSLGYEVATFVRAASEVQAIARLRPFTPAQVKASGGRLQVSLLSGRPSARVRTDVLAMATDHDRLAFGERELYWLPSGGILDSALDLKAIDALLGTNTRRTKNTVEQIARKHFAD
jgi:uncharacterized protein (DUF1697 family)